MIIVEGLDGTGKTSLVAEFKKLGFNDVSYDYDKSTQSFATKYKNIILETAVNGVSDRSFISEVAKGNIVRGVSRLSDEEYEDLLSYYSSFGTLVIYLRADKKTLLKRRENNPNDLEMLTKHFEAVDKRYDEVLSVARRYLPVYEIDTAQTTISQVLDQLVAFGVIEQQENAKPRFGQRLSKFLKRGKL